MKVYKVTSTKVYLDGVERKELYTETTECYEQDDLFFNMVKNLRH